MGRTNNISILSATAASTTTTSEDDDGGGGGQGFHFQVGKVAQPVGSWSSTHYPASHSGHVEKVLQARPFGDSDTR